MDVRPIAAALGADLKHRDHSRKSRPAIDSLNDQWIAPEFSRTLRWEPRQLTIWDNWTTLHNAVNDDRGYRRKPRA